MLPLAKMWGKKTVGTQQAERIVAVTRFKLQKNNSLKVWNQVGACLTAACKLQTLKDNLGLGCI